MPTISPFINPAVNYGPDAQDYTAEAQALQRRRAITDAVLKQALGRELTAPVATSSNQLSSRVTPFQAFAKIGEVYAANKAGQRQEGQELDLAARYKAAEAKATADFLAGDANDTKHLMAGMTSQFPAVKAAATEVYKETMKGKITPKDLLTAPDTSAPSRVAAIQSGDVSKLAPKPVQQIVPEGGTALEHVPGQPAGTATVLDKGKQYELNPDGTTKLFEMKDENGHIVKLQREVGTGKLEPVDKSNKINVSATAENKAQNELAVLAGKKLDASSTTAAGAVQSISTAHKIKDALQDPNIIVGSGAKGRQLFSRLMDTLGVTGKDTEEKLANTQKLIQAQAQAELDASYQMKGQGQITEAERALLKRTAAGDFGNTREELQARVDAMEKAGRFRIRQHGELVKRYRTDYPGSSTSTFEVEEPPEYKSANDAYKAKPAGGMARPPAKKDNEAESYRIH